MVTSSPSFSSLSLLSLSLRRTLASSVQVHSQSLPFLSVKTNSFLSGVILLILPLASSARTGTASPMKRARARITNNHLGNRIMVLLSLVRDATAFILSLREIQTAVDHETPSNQAR